MTTRRVLFISRGEDAPSTRYRALAYFPMLEAAGWSARHIEASRDWATRMRLLNYARKADVVVVLRKTFSGVFRCLLAGASKKLVLDIDDAIYLRDTGEASSSRMKRFAAMARCCDEVWCGNSHLATEAARHNSHVTLLPTSIDPARYTPREAMGDTEMTGGAGGAGDAGGAGGEGDASPPTLVWIGSGATRKYLEDALAALEQAAGRVPGLRLKIIADFTLQSDKLAIDPVPWVRETEATELAAAHIGIAPMNNDPWTRGKCGLKVLQYMAAGLPVIASRVGVHGDLVAEGETGLLVDDAQQWPQAVAKLAGDAGMREKMGAAGRARAVACFSVEVTGGRMVERLGRWRSRMQGG